MKIPFDPIRAAKAFSTGIAENHGAPIKYRVVRLGRLALPSGSIVAADPFLAKYADAFERTVRPGRYMVSFALATLFSDEVRVAFARLRFSDSPVAQWELASVPRQEELPYAGYGVDSSIGSFMDAAYAAKYVIEPEGALERKICDRLDKKGGALMRWSFWSPENLACFSSGRGDGVYASYFGLDVNGEPAELVTDFQIGNTLDPASMSPHEIEKALQHGGELRDRVLSWMKAQ